MHNIITEFCIKNFKCFGPDEQKVRVRPFNLIIGRNNSGKSAIVDAISYVTQKDSKYDRSHYFLGSAEPTIYLTTKLTEDVLRSVFRENTSGGNLGGDHWRDNGIHLLNSEVTWNFSSPNVLEFARISYSETADKLIRKHNLATIQERYLGQIINAAHSHYRPSLSRRVNAERMILPEEDSPNMDVMPDGTGITNIIQRFINKTHLDRNIIEGQLLGALNTVFTPDATFTRITCMQSESTGKWEIYLHEKNKGEIALSNSGCGIKTTIFVLAELHLIPRLKNLSVDKIVYCFEELENNLHPALLRRLLKYIYNQTVEKKSTCFLTTHSNIAIDQYSTDPNSQILHVTHNETTASVLSVSTRINTNNLLNDLDVRASDLLQSNCVLWVEGPSDRAYLSAWIQRQYGGSIQEGYHYQFVFYGGRILSHLTAEEDSDGIEIFRVNRHSIVICDSDKRSDDSEINETKRRISLELQENGAFCWITEGREIENYLDPEVLLETMGIEVKSPRLIGQFEKIEDYLSEIDPKAGKRYLKNKSLYSSRYASLIHKHKFRAPLDLAVKLREIYQYILKANRVPEHISP